MNRAEKVRTQYADNRNLAARTRLHTLYSTNKQDLTDWLFDQYQFSNGNHILEVGCGDGHHYEGQLEKIPSDAELILSDFSEGMVDIVRDKFKSVSNIKTERIDVQSIPYGDKSFDVVIANFVLYHVPDLNKALAEIQRVLKSGGTFYAATNGNGGMNDFLHKAFLAIDPESEAFTESFSFSVQNGGKLLESYFNSVEYHDHPDALEITETADLMEWIRSTDVLEEYSKEEEDKLFNYFDHLRQRDGAVRITKECGMFVCRKD